MIKKILIGLGVVVGGFILLMIFAPDPEEQRVRDCLAEGTVPLGSPFSTMNIQDYCETTHKFRIAARGLQAEHDRAAADLKP